MRVDKSGDGEKLLTLIEIAEFVGNKDGVRLLSAALN